MRLRTTPKQVHWSRLRAAVLPVTGKRRRIIAFWNSLKPAMSRFAGRAGLVCVIAARAVWFRDRWFTTRNRSTNLPRAMFSFAVPNRLATSSSICDAAHVGAQVQNQGGADEAEPDAGRD